MPESTLSLAYETLLEETAVFLGYGRTASSWSADMEADLASLVKMGLRQFYWPQPLPGEAVAHDWTFLKPTREIGIASGQWAVELPADFGSAERPVLDFSQEDGSTCPVPLQAEGQVLRARAESPDAEGRPTLAGIRPRKGTGPGSGQRHELVVWPTPDADYTALLTYAVLPDALTEGRPHPYGGAQHAQTVLASCLAAAELFKDDARGPRWDYYLGQLAASVSADRRGRPQAYGYNADRRGGAWRARHWPNYTVTVNGSDPG